MLTILLIAIGLSFDSFATSISLGITNSRFKTLKVVLIAFIFATFQATTPLLGYIAGNGLEILLSNIDHWVAFVLLSGVGIKFIFEALKKHDSKYYRQIDWKVICLLGFATSIDALVIGISLAFIDITLSHTLVSIWFVTFIATFAGYFIGKKCSHSKNSKIEIIGGIVLIAIGIKILFSHLMQ